MPPEPLLLSPHRDVVRTPSPRPSPGSRPPWLKLPYLLLLVATCSARDLRVGTHKLQRPPGFLHSRVLTLRTSGLRTKYLPLHNVRHKLKCNRSLIRGLCLASLKHQGWGYGI